MPSAGAELAIPGLGALLQCSLCGVCGEQFNAPSKFEVHTCYNTRSEDQLPAFKCSLCPKRFTRAFNLRSHLLTHTDERPFVCTACGLAFVRNNDRKSHEFLHLGEKKFVCKGGLANGHQWGCGRRFSRKKNLQRHFTSGKGRCIKPLRDQESSQRQSALLAASALTGLGNSSSALGQDRQQPPKQNRPYVEPQLSIDMPPNSWTSNGDQVSRPGPNPPQLFMSSSPSRDEALKAADTLRQYISRHGQLNTQENGVEGYLDVIFKPIFPYGFMLKD